MRRRHIHPCFCMDEELVVDQRMRKYYPESDAQRRMDSATYMYKFRKEHVSQTSWFDLLESV